MKASRSSLLARTLVLTVVAIMVATAGIFYPGFAQQPQAESLDGGAGWINTAGPVRLERLRGKFVLLDFWTYCCINCMHELTQLKQLEKAYPNELVVIGVHSAKFLNERDSDNIMQAVMRYEIEHPVVNDSQMAIWNRYDVHSWPTLVLIDPEGREIKRGSGEVSFATIDKVLKEELPKYQRKGVMDPTPLRFELAAHKQAPTPLKFPGKITADERMNRLYISDSNHNRIVVTDLEGKLLEVIGSGSIGHEDGTYAKASFFHPQGTAVSRGYLYVADTDNHLIRRVNLMTKKVDTIAGNREQGSPWPGLAEFRASVGALDAPFRFVGRPLGTALNSPWALAVEGGDLYIAMAGPHQIWKQTLRQPFEIGPFAGNGREDIVDGRHLPYEPFELGASSFAQPSGLSSDGKNLYVADSEGSSIRAVPLDAAKGVSTVIGTSWLPDGQRLFAFNDKDGIGRSAMLQHALEVQFHDGQLYVADTYNNKIKVIDLARNSCVTLVGTGKQGHGDEPAEFDEPAGLAYAKGKLYVADTNNHLIRTIDLATKKVSTLEIAGLSPPEPPPAAKPNFSNAMRLELGMTELKVVDGKVQLDVALELPDGFKINPEAPLRYYVEPEMGDGPIERAALGKLVDVEPKSASFTIELPTAAEGKDKLNVSLAFYYCQTGSEGICKAGSVTWVVPLNLKSDAEKDRLALPFRVKS